MAAREVANGKSWNAVERPVRPRESSGGRILRVSLCHRMTGC
jgi:hypothetical protein